MHFASESNSSTVKSCDNHATVVSPRSLRQPVDSYHYQIINGKKCFSFITLCRVNLFQCNFFQWKVLMRITWKYQNTFFFKMVNFGVYWYLNYENSRYMYNEISTTTKLMATKSLSARFFSLKKSKDLYLKRKGCWNDTLFTKNWYRYIPENLCRNYELCFKIVFSFQLVPNIEINSLYLLFKHLCVKIFTVCGNIMQGKLSVC